VLCPEFCKFEGVKKSNLIVFLLLGISGLALYWYYRIPPNIDFSRIEFRNLENEVVPFDSLKYDKVVFHFYARWCGPCLREMKEISMEAKNLANRGIKVYAISDDGIAEMRMMASQMAGEITFLHVTSLDALGIHSIPDTYFLSGGVTTKKQNGVLNWDTDIFPPN
jgi:thiol-disulfide isomerase/thioredoxin